MPLRAAPFAFRGDANNGAFRRVVEAQVNFSFPFFGDGELILPRFQSDISPWQLQCALELPQVEE